jgi:carboxypeptidase C (cathepsin A)
LHQTDLVFIDPVGTGFSRIADGVERKDLLGVEADVRWVGEFVRLYLSRTGRWSSPVYLAGESYGTTRAAALAEHLSEKHGLGVAGVALISSILLFQLVYPAVGNDLPYVMALPTLAATAWHHGMTAPHLGSLEAVVDAAIDLATGDYASWMLREHRASADDTAALAQRLHDVTGIDSDILLRNRLRLTTSRFRKELRKADGIVGHFDGRLLGFDDDPGGAGAADDPSFWSVRSPFTTAYLSYLRDELNVDSDANYVVINTMLGTDWKWLADGAEPKYPDTASHLRRALLRDPALRVLLASGYYDFATPFYAAEWTFENLGLPPERRKNVTMTRYKGGHMMYTDETELAALSRDVEELLSR